jgi:hypothetical protein
VNPYVAPTGDVLLRELSTQLDAGFIQPLVAGSARGEPCGLEVLQAFAEIQARAALAVERLDTDTRIHSAGGGRRATVVMLAHRTDTTGPLTLEPGSVLQSDGGQAFALTTALAWAGGDGSPMFADAESIGQSYQQNVPVGAIRQLALPVFGAGSDASSVVLGNTIAATGGRPATLDLLAKARGVYRRVGESDESLSRRARTITDTVSPNAIRRTLDVLAGRYGARAYYHNGVTVGMACDDAACDDDIDLALTADAGFGLFYVYLPLVPGGDLGLVCDEDACDDGYTDGQPTQTIAFFGAVLATMDEIKAGGVEVIGVVMEG